MKKSYKHLINWFCMALCIIALVGCSTNKDGQSNSENKDTSAKTATLAFPWSPSGLDPHSGDSWEIMRSGTAETLIKLNEDLTPGPWLAKSWKQVNDTTWLFQLQENVTFHNGKALDAAAVMNSLQRAIDKNQGTKNLLKIRAMEVVSENELKIETTEINAALISNLANPGTIIVDVESLDNEVSYPAFTGAYAIKEFNLDESLIVKQYEGYWGEKTKLDEVTIKFIPDGITRLMALQSGDVDGATDISVDNIEVLEKGDRFDVLTAKSLRTHMVMYNMESPLFKQLAVRKAVDALIPRQEIVDSVMKGKGTSAVGPFSPVVPFGQVNKEQEELSIEQLMQQDGWRKNTDAMWEKDGTVFEATFLTFPQRPELTVMAEVIQSKLLEQGMKVNIRQVENIDDALVNEEWDLAMYSMLTAHTGSPYFFLEIFYKSNSSSNMNHFASQKVDSMINELHQITDTEKSTELAIQIQEEIEKAVPHSYVVYPDTVFAVNKELEGFKALPIEYYYNNANINRTY
ncbi:ABC transporter substrate-binding protein [Ureibacillus sinduriensis]|uniref:Peptide ABC transporter substrate-binding protein n=1 Tax=Ureibacillus sinduriensis BLB-1 = JCM 15800 TaxID=1384057 RepID=A0A0A3HX02_9BACL|nr:ABC transporter substrate-binding protein [Ureibacillus sinduriensis]KGR76979.1 peptide ABC transporter substrate-binding protein [Ureibacillus sinduriensis BLB-1 = JCM 15800]